MGFYSNLSLIAVGVDLPSDLVPVIHDAVVESGVVTTRKRQVKMEIMNNPSERSLWDRIRGKPVEIYADFGSLAPGVTLAFDDPAAKAKNTRFFVPDMVGLSNKLQILDVEDEWETYGIKVSLHGNGYLFPWTMSEVKVVIQGQPILQDLAKRLDRLIQVPPWSPPRKHRPLLEKWSTWTPGSSGWTWAISQSF